MKVSASKAYSEYIKLQMERKPVASINKSKLNLTMRIFLEAKQQWWEQEQARQDMRNLKDGWTR